MNALQRFTAADWDCFLNKAADFYAPANEQKCYPVDSYYGTKTTCLVCRSHDYSCEECFKEAGFHKTSPKSKNFDLWCRWIAWENRVDMLIYRLEQAGIFKESFECHT
jgi:hypothetical protein